MAEGLADALGAKALAAPSDITLVLLAEYLPELHPVERVWLHLNERFLSHHRQADHDAIAEAATKAWNRLLAEASRLTSLCSYPCMPGVK